jgi:hypothetical protein
VVARENLKDVVEKAWEDANLVAGSDGVLAKLEHMHTKLHDLDKKFLKWPKRRIRQAQHEFEKDMNGPMIDKNDAKSKELADLVEILLDQEEIHWLQRSHAYWLSQGDRNTRLFHQFASARCKKNMIKRLKDDSEEWVEGTKPLKPLIFQYFSNLFTSEVQETDPAVLEKILSSYE